MRLIGHLQNESSAKTLGDYLVSLDIRNLVEPDADGWAVWIYSEDQIEAGRQALASFLANPRDNKFQNASQNAAAVIERQEKAQTEFEKRVRTPNQIWLSGAIGPATVGLIIACVVATALAMLGPTQAIVDNLYISQYLSGFLPEVRHGQVWRLITPIFVHGGLLHILFNMLVLKDVGTLIESRKGSMTLIVLTIVLAIGSNLGQYFYGGPDFCGISGVLFGLVGYIWLRGQCDPDSGLYLSPITLAMMLMWFFLCLLGVIPNVANACHVYGLIMGMIIGAAPAFKRLFD
jgi:GlpG protein